LLSLTQLLDKTTDDEYGAIRANQEIYSGIITDKDFARENQNSSKTTNGNQTYASEVQAR